MTNRTNPRASTDEGILIVRNDIILPATVLLRTEQWSKDWCRVMNFTPNALAGEILNAGWSFFLLAGPICTSVYGHDHGNFMETAVARALRQMSAAGLNCLQIEDITRDTYLGAPRLRLTAHRRHIQASSVLAAASVSG